ncbi:unnamed protein product [Mytilus coruscus]|uniref:SWIM-type domain-containing protein n=1 Tax=Mytilus coruscus TaxID=42192 RepID=A0A6J8DWP1_MYTCO|nr:unnamed protein product [Mytilus coruscus]
MEKDILFHCGKWIINKYENLYDPFSGVTNNACESMNAVIKRLNKYKELPVDCFVLSMYYLQVYYITEIQRGLAGVGNYNLRHEFRHARIPKDEICIPKRVIKPDDIVKHVMSETDSVREECVKEYTENTSTTVPLNQDSNSVPLSEDPNCVPLIEDIESNELQGVICESEQCTENSEEITTEMPKVVSITDKNLSQKSLARLTVENDNVTFVQQQKAFMVKGTQGNIYAVTLLPKETCQCPSTTQCYHILAAKMFLGDETDNKPRVVNLRLLSKRNLKRNDKKIGKYT